MAYPIQFVNAKSVVKLDSWSKTMKWPWTKENKKSKIDQRLCRAGGGSNACKFLTAGENGFECGRDTAFHMILLSQSSVAKFVPTLAYPQCMNEERTEKCA